MHDREGLWLARNPRYVEGSLDWRNPNLNGNCLNCWTCCTPTCTCPLCRVVWGRTLETRSWNLPCLLSLWQLARESGEFIVTTCTMSRPFTNGTADVTVCVSLSASKWARALPTCSRNEVCLQVLLVCFAVDLGMLPEAPRWGAMNAFASLPRVVLGNESSQSFSHHSSWERDSARDGSTVLRVIILFAVICQLRFFFS